VRVYHFVSSEWGFDDIVKRRLKIARIHELNDPFELLGAVCRNADERAAWLDTKARAADLFGLICFSTSWRNPVQWSHYADRHRGIALGFDVPDGSLTQVTYTSSRLDWDAAAVFNDPQIGEPFIKRLLATKFAHWRYEQEVRLFLKLDQCILDEGKHFLSFSPEINLAEVLVGSACTLSRNDLSDALGQIGDYVVCRKARPAFRSFKVVEQRRASLWE
jgi:Protein of unknown function (DUF2971)